MQHQRPSQVFSDVRTDSVLQDGDFSLYSKNHIAPSVVCVFAAGTTINVPRHSEDDVKDFGDEEVVVNDKQAAEVLAIVDHNATSEFETIGLNRSCQKVRFPNRVDVVMSSLAMIELVLSEMNSKSSNSTENDRLRTVHQEEALAVKNLLALSLLDIMAPDCGLLCCDPFCIASTDE